MTDQEPTTITGAVSRVADRMLSVLPPAFIMLVALNVAFLGTVLWFLNSQMTQRVTIMTRVLDVCLEETNALRHRQSDQH